MQILELLRQVVTKLLGTEITVEFEILLQSTLVISEQFCYLLLKHEVIELICQFLFLLSFNRGLFMLFKNVFFKLFSIFFVLLFCNNLLFLKSFSLLAQLFELLIHPLSLFSEKLPLFRKSFFKLLIISSFFLLRMLCPHV